MRAGINWTAWPHDAVLPSQHGIYAECRIHVMGTCSVSGTDNSAGWCILVVYRAIFSRVVNAILARVVNSEQFSLELSLLDLNYSNSGLTGQSRVAITSI